MKKLALIISILFCFQLSQAQQSKSERFKAEKIAFITEELNLTSQEAQVFWPMYNEMASEINVIHKKEKAIKAQLKNYKELDGEKSHQMLKKSFEYEKQIFTIREKYLVKFKTILSAQKSVGVFVAEEKFKRHLLRKLRDK